MSRRPTEPGFDIETFGEPERCGVKAACDPATMFLMIIRRSLRGTTGRFVAATLVGAMALAACGGGGSGDVGGGDASEAAEALPAVEVADAVSVDAAANVATNLLPDLVVDNLSDSNKVNLRNFGVGEQPILLWMWAPH